jgi:acetyl-CoA synthetase
MMSADHEIDNLLHEERHFAPNAEFSKNAIAQASLYEEAKTDRLGFWAKQAKNLHWHKPFTQVLDWSNAPSTSRVSQATAARSPMQS